MKLYNLRHMSYYILTIKVEDIVSPPRLLDTSQGRRDSFRAHKLILVLLLAQ